MCGNISANFNSNEAENEGALFASFYDIFNKSQLQFFDNSFAENGGPCISAINLH